MTKLQLLTKLHKALWKSDDRIDQEDLWEVQGIVDKELIDEHNKGNCIVKQYDNGFINDIRILNRKAGE